MNFKKSLALILASCMAFSVGLIKGSAEAAPTVTVKGNISVVYVGQYVEYTFTNLTEDMEFGFLSDNNGSPLKGGVKNYRKGKTGTYSEKLTVTEAGVYHVAVWKTGWDFQCSQKITVAPTVTISGSDKIGVGKASTFVISGVKSSLEFGIFPGNENGSIKSYSVSNYAKISGDTSKTVTLSETGYYVAAVWSSGWSFAAQLPFRVTASEKNALLDKSEYFESELISITTENWESDDFFAIYASSVNDITADTPYVYSGKDAPGKASYTVDTTGWKTGEYRFAAFASGNYSSDLIADISFKIKTDKRVVTDKSTYTTDEVINVTAENWLTGDGSFIRIYKKPVSGYNSGVLADTYGISARESYKFYPYNWEPGEYQLTAFEKTGWRVINQINLTVISPAEKAFEITDGILTANEDITLDLSEVYPDVPDGKLFTGWETADGLSAENNASLSEGDTLKAVFIDFNSDSTDFKIDGISVRTEKATGLRFTVALGESFAEELSDVAEYGAAVLPSDILGADNWAELELNKPYYYNGKSYAAADIPAERIFDTENGITSYTVCITDITDQKLMRQYTVRGYIKYKDINGNSRILYTDYASANMYAVAAAELENTEDSVKRKLLGDIVGKVKAIQSKKYSNTERITVTGSAADKNRYIYKLGENGISVREAEIRLGLDTPIEIVQLTDAHLNYLNARDYAEKNPTVLSSNDIRTFGKNVSSVGNLRNALDFARTADAVVLTGDTFDYLTYGGIELLHKEVWDIIPNAIVTVGNHEYLQKMQGLMPETLSADARWKILRDNWKHDIDYSSRVIRDRLMIIQLNNGEGKFYDGQKAMLEADIALARKSGYKILMFMHEPICTGNPSDTAIAAIRKDDSSASGNYYSGQVGASDCDSATKIICEIISANGDLIKGVFNGHQHADYYSEILATTATGESTVIPQYTLSGCIYGNGNALKITVS